MKRQAMIATVLMSMNCIAQTQVNQAIRPVILMESRGGSGPGEYAIEMDYPLPAPVVDNREHIYILDVFNNRVHHYDATGKLLESIPIESSESLSPGNHNSPFRRKPIAEYIDYIDGSIYARQQRCVGNPKDLGCTRGHLLRLQGNTFVNADGDKNATSILNKLTNQYRYAKRDKDLAGDFLRLGATRGDFFRSHPLVGARPELLTRVLTDKDKNIWCIGGRIRVYSPTGAVIYDEDLVGLWAFSQRGNLYILFESFETDVKDYVIRLMKFSLEGK